LEALYGSVDNVDVWVGGLAEDHVRGSSMGELFSTVIADQFQRIRDGDANWYQNVFAGRQLSQIENTTLSDVIQRNTAVRGLQENVFFDASDVPERPGPNDRPGRPHGGRRTPPPAPVRPIAQPPEADPALVQPVTPPELGERPTRRSSDPQQARGNALEGQESDTTSADTPVRRVRPERPQARRIQETANSDPSPQDTLNEVDQVFTQLGEIQVNGPENLRPRGGRAGYDLQAGLRRRG
jgi:hypothetical protein